MEHAMYICRILPLHLHYCCRLAPAGNAWLADTCLDLRVTVQHQNTGVCPALDGTACLSDWCSCSDQDLVAASWTVFAGHLQIDSVSEAKTKSMCSTYKAGRRIKQLLAGTPLQLQDQARLEMCCLRCAVVTTFFYLNLSSF